MEANGLEEKGKKVDAQAVRASSSKRFTWEIANFSKLNMKKLYSNIFHVGGNQWRILVFPKGRENVDHLSLYLDVADSTSLPYGWRRYALFSLSVINQFNSNYTVTKEAEHEFNESESDWGFTSFIPLSELNDPVRGYIVKDVCILEAEVRLNKEQGQKEAKREEKEDSVETQQEPTPTDQPVKADLEPEPVVSQATVPDAHVTMLPPTPENLTQEQSAEVVVPPSAVGEQPENVNLMTKTNACLPVITPLTFSALYSQQNELVALTAKNAQEEAKTTAIPSATPNVSPSSLQPSQELAVVKAEIGYSSFSELDALFSDIRNLLEGKSSKSKSWGSICPHASSVEEVAKANKIFKEFLDMKLAAVIQSGRELELKNSLSIMLTTDTFPGNLVNFTTNFLANLEQFASAQQDLREAHEKEKSIGELETTMRQLASEFVPIRNQAEAVDQEIAELERRLAEKKGKKEWLRKSLEDLAGRATTSKQALIDAKEAMPSLMVKREQAQKMIGEMEGSWEHLKCAIPLLL